MNKILLSLAFFAAAGPCAEASIRLNLYSGRLYLPDGTTAMPDGRLLLLIVSTQDNVFSLPTASSFVGSSSDDVVLASYDMQSSTGNASGANQEPITFNLTTAITPGDLLQLAWFPTLTYNAATNYQTAAPGAAGIPFGTFRTASVTVDGSTTSWVIPSDGQTHALNFATNSVGGSQFESAGRASQLTAIPEPATAMLLGGGLLLLGLCRRRSG